MKLFPINFGKSMSKKIITYLLLFSFLNYLGCYSSEIISKENFITMNEYEGELFVMMKDSTSHKYLEKEFKVTLDTLYIISHSKELSGGAIIGMIVKLLTHDAPNSNITHVDFKLFGVINTIIIGLADMSSFINSGSLPNSNECPVTEVHLISSSLISRAEDK